MGRETADARDSSHCVGEGSRVLLERETQHSEEQKAMTRGTVEEDSENVLVESDVPKGFVTADFLLDSTAPHTERLQCVRMRKDGSKTPGCFT